MPNYEDVCTVGICCNSRKITAMPSFVSACRMRGFALCSKAAGAPAAQREVVAIRAPDTMSYT